MIKDIVVKAYKFAEKAHRGQKRKYTGLPYFTHPKAVARMVEDLHGTPDMVAAALLHDVIEDCGVSYVKVTSAFNAHVADLVLTLTNDKRVEKTFITKGSYLLHKMHGMSDEALLIKLADLLHNTKYLNSDGVPRAFIHKQYLKAHTILEGIYDRVRLLPMHRILYQLIDAYTEYLGTKYNWGPYDHEFAGYNAHNKKPDNCGFATAGVPYDDRR